MTTQSKNSLKEFSSDQLRKELTNREKQDEEKAHARNLTKKQKEQKKQIIKEYRQLKQGTNLQLEITPDLTLNFLLYSEFYYDFFLYANDVLPIFEITKVTLNNPNHSAETTKAQKTQLLYLFLKERESDFYLSDSDRLKGLLKKIFSNEYDDYNKRIRKLGTNIRAFLKELKIENEEKFMKNYLK